MLLDVALAGNIYINKIGLPFQMIVNLMALKTGTNKHGLFKSKKCGILLAISLMNIVALWDTVNSPCLYGKVKSIFTKLEIVVRAKLPLWTTFFFNAPMISISFI